MFDLEEKDLNLARQGNVETQKIILENCEMVSLSISYKYLRSATCCGLKFEDLRDIVPLCCLKALNSYDSEKLNFYDYFKYLYLNAVKNEIRNAVARSKSGLSFENLENLDENYGLQFQSPLYQENKNNLDYLDLEKLSDLLFVSRKIDLTEKELKIMKLYFERMSIKDISRTINRNYTETFRSIKKAIIKIRNYFGVEN